MRKIYIFSFLLCCLSTQKLWSRAKTQNTGLKQGKIRFCFDLGWGINPGLFLSGVSGEVKVGGMKAPIKIRSNIRLHLLVGYAWIVADKKKLGVDAGIGYDFFKKISIPAWDMQLQEYHLYFPIIMSSGKIYDTNFYLVSNSYFGFEVDWIIASYYEQNGPINLHPSFHGSKNLREFLPELPRVSGSLLFGNRWDFAKGVYVKWALKIPLDLFMAASYLEKESDQELNNLFVSLMRARSASILEINVGLNIMGLIDEQVDLHRTRKYKK